MDQGPHKEGRTARHNKSTGLLLKGQTELASLKWDVMVSQWFMESKTKKLKARLHNLLHTLPGRVRGWMSLYSVWRWRVPSRMRFSSSRRSLQFPLWLLTSLTQPRSCRLRNLENTSGEWEEFLPFVFPQPPPPTTPTHHCCSLNFGCLCTAGLLSFLLFLNAAQQ